MNSIYPPPKFLNQVGPQSQADWVSLQKWFVSVYNALGGGSSLNYAFSTNIAYDTTGTPDMRPGTWGNAGFVDVPVPFVAIPAGQQVRLMRVYGTLNGWAHGVVPAGTNAGLLFGILAYGAGQSPFVGPGLGASGNPVYIQDQVGSEGCTVEFDYDVSSFGLLVANPSGVTDAIIRLAIYLNDTGLSIHQEISMIVEFAYE